MTTRQQAREILDAIQAIRDKRTTAPRSESAGGAQPGLSFTSGTVVLLGVPEKATSGEIYVRTASIVFTRDGSAPTATKGFQANSDDIIVLDSRSKLVNFRGIAVSATATGDVEYFSDVSD